MASFKPLLVVLLIVFMIAMFLNFFIVPFAGSGAPETDSVLYGLINFIENGWTFNVPIIGTLFPNLTDVTMSPVTWFWLGIPAITDFIVEDLTVMTFIPNVFIIPFMIIFTLAFAFSIVTIIRGN